MQNISTCDILKCSYPSADLRCKVHDEPECPETYVIKSSPLRRDKQNFSRYRDTKVLSSARMNLVPLFGSHLIRDSYFCQAFLKIITISRLRQNTCGDDNWRGFLRSNWQEYKVAKIITGTTFSRAWE